MWMLVENPQHVKNLRSVEFHLQYLYEAVTTNRLVLQPIFVVLELFLLLL